MSQEQASVSEETERPQRSLAISIIDSVDFSPIIETLCRPIPDGQGWSRSKAMVIVEEYRRFLKLNYLYPAERIVPNRMVDTVWHTHILDTRKYVNDCNKIFGRFLHHHPYFGLRNDTMERDSAFDHTHALYQKLFGRSLVSQLSDEAGIAVISNGHADIRAAGCDAADIRAAGCDAADIRATNRVVFDNKEATSIS